MKLLTNALLKRFSEVGSQEDIQDPTVITKFFDPEGAGAWYAVSYDPKDEMFFGIVSSFGDFYAEWGYFSLAELESFVGLFGLGIERDLYWNERPASKAIPKR